MAVMLECWSSGDNDYWSLGGFVADRQLFPITVKTTGKINTVIFTSQASSINIMPPIKYSKTTNKALSEVNHTCHDILSTNNSKNGR